jgi:uncharacterized membrane protein YkoI
MKLNSLLALALLVSLPLLQASPPGTKGGAKITKNQAEHIALKPFPGARVTAAKLATVEGKLVWSVEIAKADSPEIRKVRVDAMSGRVISGEKIDR